MKRLEKAPKLPLRFPYLDKGSLKLQVYSDSSYANNPDETAQIGYIIFLADKYKNCQPIYWCSKKAKRVNRSVLGSETMAFAGAFDMAYLIKRDLEIISMLQIPIVM